MTSKTINLSKVDTPANVVFWLSRKAAPALALAPTGMDFSDDVFVSAAEVEDNNEVIENLSNLAFDKSSGGDLMSLNPKFCNMPKVWSTVSDEFSIR